MNLERMISQAIKAQLEASVADLIKGLFRDQSSTKVAKQPAKPSRKGKKSSSKASKKPAKGIAERYAAATNSTIKTDFVGRFMTTATAEQVVDLKANSTTPKTYKVGLCATDLANGKAVKGGYEFTLSLHASKKRRFKEYDKHPAILLREEKKNGDVEYKIRFFGYAKNEYLDWQPAQLANEWTETKGLEAENSWVNAQ